MADKAKLPGQASDASEDKAPEKFTVARSCRVNLGIEGDDEGGKPTMVTLRRGEDLTKDQVSKIGAKKIKDLATLGRIVDANSDEARYVKARIAKEAEQANREIDPGAASKK